MAKVELKPTGQTYMQLQLEYGFLLFCAAVWFSLPEGTPEYIDCILSIDKQMNNMNATYLAKT